MSYPLGINFLCSKLCCFCLFGLTVCWVHELGFINTSYNLCCSITLSWDGRGLSDFNLFSLVFISLGVSLELPGYVVCYLTLIWEKIAVILVSNISSVPYLFFLIFPQHVCYTFCNWHSPWIFCVFFLSVLFAFVLEVSTGIASNTDSLLSCIQFTNKPIKCIHYFCYSVFEL